MKIKKTILKDFMKKALMSGEQKIGETILNFGPTGLKIDANSITQQARTTSWLKKEAFKEYEEFGGVGMNDLENFTKLLGRFGDNLEIMKAGNLLTIKSDSKKVDVELVAENFLKTDTGEPKLEFDEVFNMPSKALKGIFEDAAMSEDCEISIETKEKSTTFKNTGKYKFENSINAPSCKGGAKVNFGKALVSATCELDGNLEISVKTDYPIKVMEKTDNSIITIIVAPKIESEK